MTPDAQRIAIAEACGIIVEPCTCTDNPWRDASTKKHIPDYLNDLNAMHEAEKSFYPDMEQSKRYAEFLLDVLQIPGPFIGTARCAFLTNHATAAQRAEAFLRTIGKWVDSPQ